MKVFTKAFLLLSLLVVSCQSLPEKQKWAWLRGLDEAIGRDPIQVEFEIVYLRGQNTHRLEAASRAEVKGVQLASYVDQRMVMSGPVFQSSYVELLSRVRNLVLQTEASRDAHSPQPCRTPYKLHLSWKSNSREVEGCSDRDAAALRQFIQQFEFALVSAHPAST